MASRGAKPIRRSGSRLRACLGASLGLLALGAAASTPVELEGPGLSASCELTLAGQKPVSIGCRYRLAEHRPASSLSLRLGDAVLPPPTVRRYPGSGETSAVLLLVDTADASRAGTLAAIRRQLARIVEISRPHHHLGLATFDRQLRTVAPLGSAREALLSATGELAIGAPVSELYRTLLGSIPLLHDYPATRRAIYLFSDGRAEDVAYFHADVVSAASAAGIAIFGFGFSESPESRIHLQTLRRLADETGGTYVEASSIGRLPDAFLNRPFGYLDGGGSLNVVLNPSIATAVSAGGRLTLLARISVDETRAASGELPILAAQPPRNRAPPPVRTPLSGAGSAAAWVLAVGGVVLLAALAVALDYLRRRRRTAGSDDTDRRTRALGERAASEGDLDISADELTDAEPASGIFGYLELRDRGPGMQPRYPITRAAFRIGRSSDNDLTLPDPSISRHHAEIRLRRDGTFVVRDLESMNGVYVNDKRVRSSRVNEGDTVELGDVAMLFTFSGESALAGEETLVLSPEDTDSAVVDLDFNDKGVA